MLFISDLYSVSKHDCPLFKPTFIEFMKKMKHNNIHIEPGTPVNLDPGFDSKENKNCCLKLQLFPNVKCNPRNSSKLAVAPKPEIYKQRYVNERAFAWEDNYRRLVTRYEVKAKHHYAFCLMAAALTIIRLLR
jgi:hypothetical protein